MYIGHISKQFSDTAKAVSTPGTIVDAPKPKPRNWLTKLLYWLLF